MESEDVAICSDMALLVVVDNDGYFEDVSIGHVDEYCECNLVDDFTAFNDDGVLSKKELEYNFECNCGCKCCE